MYRNVGSCYCNRGLSSEVVHSSQWSLVTGFTVYKYMRFYSFDLSGIDSFVFIVPLPARRAGVGLLFLPASHVWSFIHSFDTLWFPDSHSWTKPHRILFFGTMIDPIKTLLGIVRQLPSRIFDLVITYFLSLELLSGLSFLNQTT